MPFNFLPNSGTLLAAVLAALFCFGGGYGLGTYRAGQSCKAEQVDAANTALAEVNHRIEVARESAIEETRRETLASIQSKSARKKGIARAKTKNNPVCALDTVDFSLLNSAVDAANGAAATNAVLDGMSSVVEAVKP